ncbi:hypothetical protein At1g04090-like [Diospyros lotus]|uniref:hypothetical protein At1g04090-like n=1 Tax=Diospyros lotus TaxID=55363 RepID=UPI00224D4E09|nr:hypothetical protein At1g04090-like [Diospyros lotus]
MFGCECFSWKRRSEEDDYPFQPQPFSLPSPLPQWPPGQGFATGTLCLGEIEVRKITKFESIWNLNHLRGKEKGVTFYRPAEIPDGFFSLGHYCQPNDQPLRGYLLVAREIPATEQKVSCICDPTSLSPALRKPLGYKLVWSTDSHYSCCGYVWLPEAPAGYKPMGFVVSDKPDEPAIEEVRCVREDLTETSETCEMMMVTDSRFLKPSLKVWSMRPIRRGMFAGGVSVGTFFCTTYDSYGELLNVACLKNLDSSLCAMPNLDQIHSLIGHYGPTVFFHPDEEFLPSSVAWFFKNGALLYKIDRAKGLRIDYKGSNLPSGGINDGEYWIDLPEDDDQRNYLKKGNMESAELYVHVKPALGGTFTDIVMWVFCPFNGPATIKAGLLNLELRRIGEHVGDWEHFTLRVSNFTGELWSVYFSEHSGGGWVDASDLEFIDGNKPIVYSSKSGHASFPHPGTYIQGSSKLSIGVRNDTAQSKYYVDSSTRYQIIAAEYLGNEAVTEPHWLQYMREWGPTIVYDARSELDKIISHFPMFLRFSAETLFELFPTEIYGEEGPTGPKEKDNWIGDERC